jgi:hypothetical protein
MKKIWLVGAATAMLFAGSALAAEPRGTVTYTGTESYPPFYLDCVNEVVSATANYESRFHQFETAGGTVHVLDNWSYTTLYTSATGRQWISHGVSPAHLNMRLDKASAVGYTSSSRVVPVDGGPQPSFMFKSNYKIAINALGEVVVQILPVPGEGFRCLGPKG